MNVFNRIVMVLVSLVIFAFGTMAFLLLTRIVVPNNSFLRDILALYAAWQAVALLNGLNANISIVIAFVLGLIGLVVLVLELIPFGRIGRGRSAKQYVVHHDPLGEVTVAQSMVRSLIQHETIATPGVTQVVAEPQVKESPNGLRVSTRAALSLDASAPGVGQVLQERIKESIQNHLGLPVAEVTVATQAAPPPKPTGRRVA
jgi:uncharacterized alkaline shock family protein YloU